MKKYIVILVSILGIVNCGTFRKFRENDVTLLIKDTINYKLIESYSQKKDSIYKFLVKSNGVFLDTCIIKIRKGIILSNKTTSIEYNNITYLEYFPKSGNKSREYLTHNNTIVHDLYFYDDKIKSLNNHLIYSNGQLKKAYEYYPIKKIGAIAILKSEKNYENGKPNGELTFYRKNGIVKSRNFYKNGQETKVFLYDKKGEYKACIGCVPIN